jgi:hypothetical protein
MTVRTILFDQGQNQGIDRSLLDGRFSLVRNGVLSRDGQLRPRPGYTALPDTLYGSGTFVAYDLFAYGERLVAFGDSMGMGYPTDLFEYVTGGAAAWRGTTPNPTHIRLPRATGVRDLAQPPDQQDGVVNFGCAAVGGFTCLVWNNADAGGGPGFVHVVNAETGQTLELQQLSIAVSQPTLKLRALALDDRFVIVGTNYDGDDLGAWHFRPAQDESLQLLNATLTTDASTYLIVATCRVVGSAEFVTATLSTGGDIVVRRFNGAGVLQVPSGGQYPTITPSGGQVERLSLEADGAANRITLAYDRSGVLRLHSFNLTTGAQVGAGPFVAFPGSSVQEHGLVRSSPTEVYVVAHSTSPTEPSVLYGTYNTTTNALGTVATLPNLRLASTPIFNEGDLVFAVRHGGNQDSQSNALVTVRPSIPKSVTTVVAKDFEVSTSQSDALPDLCRDDSTGLIYWANAALSADLQASPRVTELSLNSAERRQVCQAGSLVLIAGGCPAVYDGTQLFECGYLSRPRIVSVTPSNGAGALIPGATYLYKEIWEALDSDDNVWRSALSETFEVTMGAAHDTNTIICETPPSMRVNAGAGPTGSVVRAKLYRTVAVADETVAVITGTIPADPPGASLNGHLMAIFINDSGGATLLNVVFGPADVTLAQVIITINAVTTGRVIASNANGALRLTSVEEGSSVALNSGFGVAAESVFGLSTETAFGTTEFTTGEIFHLAATKYTGTGTDVGKYVSVVDVMSDDDLREQQILYTQAENPLDHFAPTPADLCSSGGSQVSIAGQPRRDRWTVSKPFAQALGVQFANPGREAFSQRVRGDIEAIIQRDTSIVLFTSREIWEASGQGPDRAGRGTFERPRLVYGEGGLRRGGWRSIISVTDGTFFQLDDDKLYALRPGGVPEWIGHPVLETLAAYPAITASCHVKKHQTLVFACQSEDGTDGVLLRYDLRRKQWFEDDVGAVDAIAEYDGRLVLVQNGAVFLQDENASGALPTLTVRIGSFLNFGTVGWGGINSISALGTFQGDCTLDLQISYDDGRTWTSCGVKLLSSAVGYAAGSPIEEQWHPAIMECSRFQLQVIVSSSTEDSGGAWIHSLDIDVEKDPGPARKGQAYTR